MIELIKRILLSKGVNIADIKIDRILMEIRKGIIIPTDDWSVAFKYQGYYNVVELNEVSTRQSWASLVKYYNGDMISLVDRVELANMTPRELYETIEEFIHR